MVVKPLRCIYAEEVDSWVILQGSRIMGVEPLTFDEKAWVDSFGFAPFKPDPQQSQLALARWQDKNPNGT